MRPEEIDKLTPVLPQGFEFTPEHSIAAEEALRLRNTVGWSEESPYSEEIMQKCLNESLSVVGVRSDQGELVGIGFLTGNHRHAVLCDFNVNPTYQRRGIGTAILKERMRIVDELGIRYLYTNLSDDNPLKQLYIEFGFKEMQTGLFRVIPQSP